MRRLLLFFFIGLPVVISSCLNSDKKSGDINPSAIYFDYKISAEEGNDNLTVILQYRDGGEDGDAFTLMEPAKVWLDEETIAADSSKMTGTYYEIHKTIASFSGKHTIKFIDWNKKQYHEEFNFQPLRLQTEIPDTINRDNLIFQFDGLEPEDNVRVLLTDTSFFNDGVNRLDTVRNGRLIISKDDLELLADGLVQLEFIREYERPVKNGTKAGGRLAITYSLKREFVLKE